MKKLLLLTLIGGFAITANAQWHDDNRPGPGVYQRNNPYYNHDQFGRVAEINARFDQRIESVKCDPYLRGGQKRRQIRELERDRRIALAQARDGYAHRGRDFGYHNRF